MFILEGEAQKRGENRHDDNKKKVRATWLLGAITFVALIVFGVYIKADFVHYPYRSFFIIMEGPVLIIMRRSDIKKEAIQRAHPLLIYIFSRIDPQDIKRRYIVGRRYRKRLGLSITHRAMSVRQTIPANAGCYIMNGFDSHIIILLVHSIPKMMKTDDAGSRGSIKEGSKKNSLNSDRLFLFIQTGSKHMVY